MTLTATQRAALDLLTDLDGERVYLSNRLDRENKTIPTLTADSLEARGLVETEDIGRIGECWTVRLTDAGRVEARG